MDKLGGVITNLHQPRDWGIIEERLQSNLSHNDEVGPRRVHFAVGCHPKQAALLSANMLKRLEDIVRSPGVVAVGECGLDYSAR